jgi:hypothetical protein
MASPIFGCAAALAVLLEESNFGMEEFEIATY